MKFATAEEVKKLRESGMRKKDKDFWGGISNHTIWLCWMNSVIKYLEDRKERLNVKNSQ